MNTLWNSIFKKYGSSLCKLMCVEGVFYPEVTASKCLETVCIESCYANAKNYTGFLNVFLKILYWPHSHFPQARQMGRECFAVSHWRYSCNRRETKIDPLWNKVSVKQWMHSLELYNLCEMTCFTVIISATGKSIRARQLTYFISVQISQVPNQKLAGSLNNQGFFHRPQNTTEQLS